MPDVLLELGRTTDAIQAYEKALRLNPNDAKAWNNLGVAYASTGRRSELAAIYDRLKRLDPTQAERFFNLILMP